ncbi:MAG: hypothetical protein A2X59_04845 [Nitrospirae bacterium GWC2_42_7]|nr:MAG: hypothetical protein A2X59_04845 [Nitrospirae bacterium GWC2_42_7]
MKINLVIVLLVLFLFPTAAYSQQDNITVFTEEDLKKYEKPYDNNRSSGASGGQTDQNRANEMIVDPLIERSDVNKSKSYTVPYIPFEGSARRIIIPVTINGSVTAKMAVDTGSPGMLIFDSLAKKLGIFESDDAKLLSYAGGIGGVVPAVLTIIDKVQVGELEDHFIPTTITPSISEAFEGLVGMDFMANFSVKIDTRKHVVVFEELPASANMPAGHDEVWWRSNFHNFAAMRSEWKNYRDSLKPEYFTDPRKYNTLKEFAYRQYKDADDLFNKLNGYAIRHSVPMRWRKY